MHSSDDHPLLHELSSLPRERVMRNDAAVRLRGHASDIMPRWEARVHQELAAATQQESRALQNSLPEYLDRLASALSATVDRTHARVAAGRADSLRIAVTHGRE